MSSRLTDTFVMPDPSSYGEFEDANWYPWWIVKVPEGWNADSLYRVGMTWERQFKSPDPDAAEDFAGEDLAQYLRGHGCEVTGPVSLAWGGVLR